MSVSRNESGAGPLKRFLLAAAGFAVAAALAGCNEPRTAIHYNKGKEHFAEGKKWGKASRKVIADGEPVPRGGGQYLVGKPYHVAGKTYVPREDDNYSVVGMASWYGAAFHGRRTSNGEIYDMSSITAAHPTMPLPSYARVTNLANGYSLIVRVNDRGPFSSRRVMDVSARTAQILGFKEIGTGKIKVEYIGRAPLEGSDDNMLLASLRTDGTPATLDGYPSSPVMVASAATSAVGGWFSSGASAPPAPPAPVPVAEPAPAPRPKPEPVEVAAAVPAPQQSPRPIRRATPEIRPLGCCGPSAARARAPAAAAALRSRRDPGDHRGRLGEAREERKDGADRRRPAAAKARPSGERGACALLLRSRALETGPARRLRQSEGRRGLKRRERSQNVPDTSKEAASRRHPVGFVRLVLILLLVGGVAAPWPARADAFSTSAEFALLEDYDSGAVLYEKNADKPMPPVSLAKLMTAEIVFSRLKAGKLSLGDTFEVSEDAWRQGGAPSRGAAMFLSVHSRASVDDLLQGLLVQSGNDAAMVLAEGLAGSEEEFARLMNRRAGELGMTHSQFANARGKADPSQFVTARDMGVLAAHVIRDYPDYFHYFSEKEFTWNKIRQLNRNPTLSMTDLGVDGLKAGDIGDGGYAVIATAVQDGQRLILVLNGLKSAADRLEETRKLLNYGFHSFERRQLFDAGATVGWASVYGGASGSAPLVSDKPVVLFVPRGDPAKLNAKIVYAGPLPAPVVAGREVGRLKVWRGDMLAVDVPLKTGGAVALGGLTRRAFDATIELAGDAVRRQLKQHGLMQ